jgi:hypothetical protein
MKIHEHASFSRSPISDVSRILNIQNTYRILGKNGPDYFLCMIAALQAMLSA